jgi:hypothetical protein
MGTIVGAVVSASLGAAFWDWRTIVVLAVVGDVGFGLGANADDFLTLRGGGANYLVRTGSISVGGGIAGARLGAVLEYLENRNLASGRRPRVR